MSGLTLSPATINRLVRSAKYAVRGPIVEQAAILAEKLKDPKANLPFEKVISCNIGNPRALNHPRVSFMRDVLSLVINPALLDRSPDLFTKDVMERAQKYAKSIPDIGAYSESQGIRPVREEIAEFLTERDGYAASPDDVFLTNGASQGVNLLMTTLIRDDKDGILCPIPQYPLYSATTTLLNGSLVPYYLDESSGWSCDREMLSMSLKKAKDEGITVRSLVVINPGNPTGQVLQRKTMEDIVQFCVEENIVLMADEVYQENIWGKDEQFISFRKVGYDLGVLPLRDQTPGVGNNNQSHLSLVSFHSTSKGFLGECGLRGGYFEALGIDKEVMQEVLKLASISLCPNTVGQIATGLMVRPPIVGDEAYPQYESEKNSILESMQRRAVMLSSELNSLEGVSCNPVEGSMYAFPTISLPAKAIEKAESLGLAGDELYCSELLDATGIVVVAGSGFGQKSGSFHFRTTILPPENEMFQVVTKFKEFHKNFLSKYS